MENNYIVAIGGSSGSLDPMMAFFNRTPLDHACYIILRHLPAHHQSQLGLLLSRQSQLQIVPVADGITIAPNHIYVPPTDAYIVIRGEQLYLVPRTDKMNNTLDIFLQSLAAFGSRAIAILLSGSGADGVAGLQAVRATGGLTIAQEPDTCSFPFMPMNAINAGCIDEVMAVGEMPAFIQEHVRAERAV